MTGSEIQQVAHEGPRMDFLPGRRGGLVSYVNLGYDPSADPGPPLAASARFRVPGHRGLEAHAQFATRGGCRVITQLWIVEPDNRGPAAGITYTALRALKLSEVQSEVDAILANYQTRTHRRSRVNIGDIAHRPTRPRRPDSFYLDLAVEYVRSASRRRVADLAAKYNVSISTMREWIRTTRKRGFLTSEGQGTVGGRLTAYAEQQLRGSPG